MEQELDSIFEDDLVMVSQNVAEALNMFEETVVKDNKLVTMYGHEEFIALFITPEENNGKFGSLRLRTRDMAATYQHVPVGFSQINECKPLLNAMKKASHLSLKRNSLWYLDRQAKDVVGDRIVFTELKTNKGYLYKVSFTNGHHIYLTIAKDDKEFLKGHDTALLFMLADKTKNPISPPMTADECILMIVNTALQPDVATAKFISLAEQYGGKTMISHSYRTTSESVDEAKAVFANGYAMKLLIQDGNVTVTLFGQYEDKTYLLDEREFNDIQHVYDSIVEFAALPPYVPTQKDA